MGIFNFKRKERHVMMDWTFINGQFVIDEDLSTTYIDKGFKSLPNLYGIVSLITQKSSIVPHEVFRITNEGKYRKYKAQMKSASTTRDYAKAMATKAQALDKVENTEIDKLLTNPNLYQSTENLYEALDGYLLLTGNAYIFGLTTGLSSSGKKPSELHALISPAVAIKAGESWREPVSAYRLTYLTGDDIPAEEVGHIKYWNPISTYNKQEDILYGLSPLKACRTLLGKYREADIAQGSMFKNMGVNGILSGDGTFNEEQALSLRDKWKKLYGGSAKAGDIAITSANVKWNQIGLSPVDLKIIEGKEEILNELCNIYHVPIGMFTKVNSTENNMVESRKMFITDAVIPLCERRKSIINRWLVPKFGEKLVVEYDYTVFSEMNEDLEKLVSSASQMYWLNPNEKRAMTNYDKSEDPLMERFYFPANLMPLEDISGIGAIDEEQLQPNPKHLKYNPNQPRDEHGRWTDGSGFNVEDEKNFQSTKSEREDAMSEWEDENNRIEEMESNGELDFEEYEQEKRSLLEKKLQDYFGGKYSDFGKYTLRISDHPQTNTRGLADYSFVVKNSYNNSGNDYVIPYNYSLRDGIDEIFTTMKNFPK